MTARIAFDVAGLPVPQGSTRAFVTKGGKAIVTHDNGGNLRAWREAIATEARGAAASLLEGPVAVRATFLLPRPAGHSGRRGLLPSAPAFPVRKPDGDKLGRALLDALTGVVFLDDAQVVDLIVRKRYADPNLQPGVTVVVSELLP